MDAQRALTRENRSNIPSVVGSQFQQGIVDGHHCQFRTGGGSAIGTLCGYHHPRLATRRVDGCITLHVDSQAVGIGTNLQHRVAEPEGGLTKIDEGCRRGGRHASAHCQHGDERIRTVMGAHRHLEGRTFGRQRHHPSINDTLAFHGDERSAALER